MAKRKFNSRELRELAEQLVQQAAQGEDLPDEQKHADFVTALVRQWVTYDGNATLLVEDHQIYCKLIRTPLGKLKMAPQQGQVGWLHAMIEDWDIDPDTIDLDDLHEQLNRGQGAEITNRAGVPLRFWIDPAKRSCGVQPLVKVDQLKNAPLDYHKIARRLLASKFENQLDKDELEKLAGSVAGQWKRFAGHAGIFLNSHGGFLFQLFDHGNGTYDAKVRRMVIHVDRALSSLGFSLDQLPDLIAQLNLHQVAEFHNAEGVPARLRFNPQELRVHVDLLAPRASRSKPKPRFVPATTEPKPTASRAAPTIPIAFARPSSLPAADNTPPFSCSRCSAVLAPWSEGQQQQTCALCGFTITRS